VKQIGPGYKQRWARSWSSRSYLLCDLDQWWAPAPACRFRTIWSPVLHHTLLHRTPDNFFNDKFTSIDRFKVQSAGTGTKPLWRNKGTHCVISGVARVPCVQGRKIFLRPHQQKLQSLKWKLWIFIDGIDKLEGGLMVLFFGLVFPLGPLWKFFCRRPWFTAFLLDVQHRKCKCMWESKPASSLVVSLGKILNGIASTFTWLDL